MTQRHGQDRRPAIPGSLSSVFLRGERRCLCRPALKSRLWETRERSRRRRREERGAGGLFPLDPALPPRQTGATKPEHHSLLTQRGSAGGRRTGRL
ncbi:hypothetical protein SKAU_G00249600 [Synaphobranchus kaupii]|uniref:Uncharacterized protein n=1 Tax=Synaphobranchus kaupii TaxID=118154 RepID=A0A9Q1F2K2_SYNKA|nr:hypothetical protein SKAU_G00249600 [Synaphobranchus kaupii]